MNQYFGDLVEVRLKKPFLVVVETLSRMGIANKDKKVLYQSCHLLHKRGRYYIAHFKSLYALDTGTSTFDESDRIRRDSIIQILQNWGLVDILETDKIVNEINLKNLFVLPFTEKHEWTLCPKHKLGRKDEINYNF